MGLDMYMFHVEKLTDREVEEMHGMKAEQISEKYHCIMKEDFDSDPDMYSDLIPYVSQVNVVAKSFDWKRCLSDYGVAPDDVVCGSMWGGGQARYQFASGKVIELNSIEYDSYVYEHDDIAYVWKSHQVAYWRKHYDLHDYIESIRIQCRMESMIRDGKCPTTEDLLSWRTENCGYYILSAEEKELINKFLAKSSDDYIGDYHLSWHQLINNPKSTLMYHAWW